MWAPKRRHIETAYQELHFPYEELAAPIFSMQVTWSLQQLLGYLGSWSASRRCEAATGTDPAASLEPKLAAAWGDLANRRIVWPLALRIGRMG
jgi:hypothetical protein